MKKKKITSLMLIIIVLILEILPYGAVCNFMGDPETNTVIRYTYSYFDLTPYGYANFGPLLTAILSCIIALLIILSFFLKHNLNKFITIISVISILTSLMPILFGLNYYSVIGFFITVILAIITCISFDFSKNTDK